MDDEHNATPMPVESLLDLLLLLLYAPGQSKRAGEPIDGVTRLQKLVFLLQQGEGPKSLVEQALQCGFTAYKMGPFSRDLGDAVDELKSAGLVKTERLQYLLNDDADAPAANEVRQDRRSEERRVQSYRFMLTQCGLQVGRDLWHSLSRKDRDALSEFKTFFGYLPLRQLLIFVYQKFPSYAVKSEIKGQLGL